MEEKAAVDSGVCVVAEEGGTVERSTSTEITVRQDDGKLKKYKLTKFQRSNQSNCYNQIHDMGRLQLRGCRSVK